MEEKANKLGKSWKQPGKKIKLVSRLSQSEVKDLKQEGTCLWYFGYLIPGAPEGVGDADDI